MSVALSSDVSVGITTGGFISEPMGSSCWLIMSGPDEAAAVSALPLVCLSTNWMYSPEPPESGVTTTSFSAPPVDFPAEAFHEEIFDITD